VAGDGGTYPEVGSGVWIGPTVWVSVGDGPGVPVGEIVCAGVPFAVGVGTGAPHPATSRTARITNRAGRVIVRDCARYSLHQSINARLRTLNVDEVDKTVSSKP